MVVTKEQMTNSAIALFREKGFASVSVEHICKLHNVTRGSFYHYFDSKEDLLDYWLSGKIQEFIRSLEVNPDYTNYRNLQHLNWKYVDFLEEIGKDLVFFSIMANQTSSKVIGAITPSVNKLFYDLITQCMNDGSIDSDYDAMTLLTLYTEAIMGALIVWYGNEQFDLNQQSIDYSRFISVNPN